MKQNKIYSLLGLAMRGRNLVSGEFQTEDAVKKGSAMLVIVAEVYKRQSLQRMHRPIRKSCFTTNVPIMKSRYMNMARRKNSAGPSAGI